LTGAGLTYTELTGAGLTCTELTAELTGAELTGEGQVAIAKPSQAAPGTTRWSRPPTEEKDEKSRRLTAGRPQFAL
jgi:hypothetical protein